MSSRDLVADFEGPLEMAFYLTCEFDCTVLDFASQPCVVDYTAPDGKPRSYYPDTLLRFRPDRQGTVRRPWLVEVKKKQSIASEGDLHNWQTKAGEEKAAENGWTYHVLTEDEIYTPFWRNGKFLLRFLTEVVSSEDCRVMDQCLSERGPLAMEQLLQCTARALLPAAAPRELEMKRTQLMPSLYARLVQRTLTANLAEHLSLQSHVWLPRDDDPTYSPFL